MNEVIVSENVFNIADYIWYIVGGVCLLFVIIGFVADKSGLAKKTFSKDNTSKANKKSLDNSPLTESNNDLVSDVNEVNTDIAVEVNEESSANVSEGLDNIENNSLLNTNEPIYLNDVQNEETLPSFNSADSSSLSNEDELEQNQEQDLQSIQVDNIPDSTSDSSVAAENAEEEWGIDLVQDLDESDSNIDEMQLPDLNDVKPDEDVWKF